MERLLSHAHRRMRWKNGKGETVEIAIEPPDASIDTFNWRISTAAVVEDGAFSCFEGVERTLAVLSGGELHLSIADRPAVRLDTTSEPLAFAADAPCSARLVGAAVTDLNVMSRRGLWRHALQRLVRAAPVSSTAATAVVVAAPGVAQLSVDGELIDLAPLDALRFGAGHTITLLAGAAWLAQFDPNEA